MFEEYARTIGIRCKKVLKIIVQQKEKKSFKRDDEKEKEYNSRKCR